MSGPWPPTILCFVTYTAIKTTQADSIQKVGQVTSGIRKFADIVNTDNKLLLRHESIKGQYLMYVPHYDAVLHAIGTSREDLKEKTDIRIPYSLFKFLLQKALGDAEFNLSGYLASNRDIQDAAKSGKVPDLKAHYVGFGFFEGRHGATPAADEAWYRRTYADVAAAISKGQLSSAAEHFNAIGAEEFRAPSAEFQADAIAWKRAIRPT